MTNSDPPLYLFEVDKYDIGVSSIVTLRFATDGYNHASAPGYYEGRVISPPVLGRFFLSPGVTSTSGANSTSTGDIVLGNDDAELDSLRNAGLAGQQIKILIGRQGIAYGDFVELSTAKCEQALFELAQGAASTTDTVTLRLRDRLIDLSQPLQSNKYLGTNSLPNGLEGVDDLKGRPKPLAFGQVANASIPCVNTSRLIYQFNDGSGADVTNVYDAGAALTQSSDYTDQSDMETNAPPSGHFRVWPGGGYVRLGTTPTGTITADILEGATSGDRTAAQVGNRIMLKGGISSGDISSGDLTALDALNASVVGIYIDQETPIQTPVDQILASVGAAGGFDRLDSYRMRRLDLPHDDDVVVTLRDSDTAPMGLTDIPVVAVRFVPTNDPDKGVPTFEISLNYAKNYTVQSGNGLSGTALSDLTRVAFLGADTRAKISTSTSVKTPNPLAVQKTVDTLLVEGTDAQDEADRQLSLYSSRRDFVEVDIALDMDAISSLDVGDAVRLAIPRYGYDDGQPMLVTGMIYSITADILTLQLWGGGVSSILDELSLTGSLDLGLLADPVTGWGTLGSLASPGINRVIDLGTL